MNKYKKWTPEEMALLGTMPDSAVAKKTGRLLCNVHFKRTSLKIPSFCKNVALLGTRIRRKKISITLPSDIVEKLTADVRSRSTIIEALLREHY